MDMTSGPLDSGSGPLPVLKTKDLKVNILGGCIPSDEVHWMGDMEMQIFIIEFGTLLTVQCRETTATEPLEASCWSGSIRSRDKLRNNQSQAKIFDSRQGQGNISLEIQKNSSWMQVEIVSDRGLSPLEQKSIRVER